MKLTRLGSLVLINFRRNDVLVEPVIARFLTSIRSCIRTYYREITGCLTCLVKTHRGMYKAQMFRARGGGFAKIPADDVLIFSGRKESCESNEIHLERKYHTVCICAVPAVVLRSHVFPPGGKTSGWRGQYRLNVPPHELKRL